MVLGVPILKHFRVALNYPEYSLLSGALACTDWSEPLLFFYKRLSSDCTGKQAVLSICCLLMREDAVFGYQFKSYPNNILIT